MWMGGASRCACAAGNLRWARRAARHLLPTKFLRSIEKTPEIFSPNVLLRAIVQDSLLPTAAYVGGPAEVAYMAQVEVVYRKLGARMPAILPRAGFTLIEPHVAHLMKKYGLTLDGCFSRTADACGRCWRQARLPPGLAKRFDADEKALRRMLEEVREALGKVG